MEVSYDIVFILGVFVAGILSFFSPCIFPLLPVYMGILLDEEIDKSIKIFNFKINLYPVLKTLSFIAGISLIFLTLGFGFGTFGSYINSPTTQKVLGIIVIIMGMHQADFLKINIFNRQKQINFNKKKRKGIFGSFLLGLGFSFGWSPCIGPVLSAVLALAATGGEDSFYGVILMAVYSLGLAIPFLTISLASSLLTKHFSKIKQNTPLIKKIGGIIIIIMGILLMLGKLNSLASIF